VLTVSNDILNAEPKSFPGISRFYFSVIEPLSIIKKCSCPALVFLPKPSEIVALIDPADPRTHNLLGPCLAEGVKKGFQFLFRPLAFRDIPNNTPKPDRLAL